MKRFFKILGLILAATLLFILLLTAGAKIFEDDIAKIAVKQISKSIDAPMEIGSVNFNLVRGFPHSTIEFNNLWLKNPEHSGEDTIAGIEHLYVSVNSRAAIDGKYQVEKIEINGLTINYQIDADSLSNIDFLMSLVPETTDTLQADTTETAPLYLNLDELLLKNISCSYYDGTSNTGGTVLIPKIVLKGNIWGNDYSAETDGEITLSNLQFGEYKLELMRQASLKFNIDYLKEDVTINNFAIQSDGIDISASGKATIGDTLKINTLLQANKIDFGELTKYIPQEMMKELGLISAQGILAFNTKITGEYGDSIIPEVFADFQINNAAIATTDYPEITHFSVAGSATNGKDRNNSSSSVNITSIDIQTPQSNIAAALQIKNLDQPHYKIKTKGHITIDEFAAFIPDSTVESLSGSIGWQMGTSGRMPKVIGDDFPDYVLAHTWANISIRNMNSVIDSTLSIENFSTDFAYRVSNMAVSNLNIGIPNYDVEIKNSSADISFNGLLTDVDNMSCEVNEMHVEFDNNTFDLEAAFSNLKKPIYRVEGKVKLDLADLQKFAPDTLINSMSGQIEAHLFSGGYIDLDSIESQAMGLAFQNVNFSLKCKDVAVDMADSLMEISALNLDMIMKPDSILVNNFSGDYKGLTFAITETQVCNVYNSVILNQKEELKVITSIEIGDIDFALFEPFMPQEDSIIIASTDSLSTDSIIPTNYTMDIKGDIAINRFLITDYEVDTSLTIKNLDISNFNTKFRVTDSAYIADSLQFNAFDGYMLTSMRYDIKPTKDMVSVRNHIDGMDFKQLLYDMDNFGQSDMTYENISGQLVSDLDLELTLLGDSLPMDKIRMKGAFTLSDGGVYNFEPANELSKFTGINELDNIEFETFTTNLFIYKGAAYIPKTDIINTAVDITAFGKQDLTEDEYEYHLELNLGDVLTGKRDNLMKRQEKAAKEEGDDVERNGANLISSKEDGKMKNGFDKKKSMDKMERKIRLQERVLDIIFHPILKNYSTEDEEIIDNKEDE